MTLPGNVPHFSTYLVDFDDLAPIYVFPPAGCHLRAWGKLVELERKLHAFDWASMVVRQPRQCTTLIADLAFAFALGFEATLQILRQEDRSKSEKWLQALPEYDMPCRGMRTMRNLEAHIRSGQLNQGIGTGVYTRFMNTMVSQPAVAWRFPAILQQDYDSLDERGQKLATNEVDEWNQYVGSEYAANIMRRTLISLVEIVKKA